MDKEQRKKRYINTENRMVTVNKRELSFEGLVEKFQNGEDGIYNLIANDKNILFTPKISITQEDLDGSEPLRELRKAIEQVQLAYSTATGRRKFLLKKQLIQMRQDQYVIKNAENQPIYCTNLVKSFTNMQFDDNIVVHPNGKITDKSTISFMNPKHVSVLLRNYSALRQSTYGRFYSDAYCLVRDLEVLVDKTLQQNFPLYYDLLIYKIDGKTNLEIQDLLYKKYKIKHSIEYISSLWRNKIPKLIADTAEKEYLIWYYTNIEYGKWKKCSCCGQIKLAHNKFFSKNSSSKDGFYSICKKCRNKRAKEKNAKVQKPKIIKKVTYKKDSTWLRIQKES